MRGLHVWVRRSIPTHFEVKFTQDQFVEPADGHQIGEAGIDNELLVQDRDKQIVEMHNGCICCTVRGDPVRILGELHAKKEAGTLSFDRVIIETTGLADPAPVVQTFCR